MGPKTLPNPPVGIHPIMEQLRQRIGQGERKIGVDLTLAEARWLVRLYDYSQVVR